MGPPNNALPSIEEAPPGARCEGTQSMYEVFNYRTGETLGFTDDIGEVFDYIDVHPGTDFVNADADGMDRYRIDWNKAIVR